MTDNIPSPEAIQAAGVLLNKLDADHITEVRAASWARATDVLARALDDFARQAVERDRASRFPRKERVPFVVSEDAP